jgi:hypothetical protein
MKLVNMLNFYDLDVFILKIFCITASDGVIYPLVLMFYL